MNKIEDPREKLLNIIQILGEECAYKTIKIPKNYSILIRKLYKYLKPHINIIQINFNKLEEIDKEKMFILGIDETWILIKLSLKEWIFNFFSALNEFISTRDQVSQNMEFYLLTSLNAIKEVCSDPPSELIQAKPHDEIKSEILYCLAEYYIILDQRLIFERYYDQIIQYAKSSRLSYKFFVILKKFFLKYFQTIDRMPINKRHKEENSIFIDVIESDESQFSDLRIFDYRNNTIYKEVIEMFIECLKRNSNEEKVLYSSSFLYNIFGKKKAFLSKELDGSNIMDFFTILNTCEEYSQSHLNNITGFSMCYEFLRFLHDSASAMNHSDKIMASISDIKSFILSYCIRIFDQSENYLEANKNKNLLEKNNDYNLNLIEAAVWESVKIINLICEIDNSLVSTINMRIKQVYERIALKQSGLVFLEILQFYINNYSLILIDLDNYISQFFKLKLRFNYKYEMLSFTTLEFLYKNREILNQSTEVFSTYFPLILKIFATFPKFLETKFFTLIDFMTKPNTVNELFNYILDLPAAILIIENFECYMSFYNNNHSKLDVEEIFQAEFVKLVKFLLRDEGFGQENLSTFPSIESYNKQLKVIFESSVITTRVHSTTTIVPKMMKKFLDVIIQHDECESAAETIVLIFERFSHFHENPHYKEEIRKLFIRKLEEIFVKWDRIVTRLREKFIAEVNNNYSNRTKRELICLLCWSLGEFLTKEDDNPYEDKGISETFACLEKLLRENIKYFVSDGGNDYMVIKSEDTVEDMVKWYDTYFIEKTTEEEISNERLLVVIITALCKLAVKYKNYVSRTVKCFKDIQVGLVNRNLENKLLEMLTSLVHISISTEYLA